MTVDLLPRKEFKLFLESGEVIHGQFSLWSVKRFTDKKKIPLSKLEEMMNKDTLTFDDICQMLLCAVEHMSRENKKEFKYTDMDACEWIEEMGGLVSETFQELMAHGGSSIKEKKSLVSQ